jgi:hypothetical protein
MHLSPGQSFDVKQELDSAGTYAYPLLPGLLN